MPNKFNPTKQKIVNDYVKIHEELKGLDQAIDMVLTVILENGEKLKPSLSLSQLKVIHQRIHGNIIS